MSRSYNQAVALGATVVAFSSLYIPQPMLPLLGEIFNVSASQAGLLMTVTMLPLAVAPVAYGYFLQAVPAKQMLIVALALLALDLSAFYFVAEFWQLLTLRLLQGLLLPAIFTALMTYCATMVPAPSVRRAMGFYIGATIVGGFAGRLAGGFFASALDWRMAFVCIGLLQLLPLILLIRVDADADINFARLDAKSLLRIWKQPVYRLLFATLAIVFFVFSGILNNAPFYLRDLDPATTPILISTLYLGYLIGAPVSFASDRINRRLGGEFKALWLGFALHAIGVSMLIWVAFSGLVLTMFFLAAGFFLIHALLSGLANQLSFEHKAVVNGLYVSIYYFSGALGSWLPGYLYDGVGWHGMVLAFLLILVLGGGSLTRFVELAAASRRSR